MADFPSKEAAAEWIETQNIRIDDNIIRTVKSGMRDRRWMLQQLILCVALLCELCVRERETAKKTKYREKIRKIIIVGLSLFTGRYGLTNLNWILNYLFTCYETQQL
jgi:hypothetical protein